MRIGFFLPFFRRPISSPPFLSQKLISNTNPPASAGGFCAQQLIAGFSRKAPAL
jgi:hypothetical protein